MIVIKLFNKGTITTPDNRTLVFTMHKLTIMNTTNRSLEKEIDIKEVDMIWYTNGSSIIYEER